MLQFFQREALIHLFFDNMFQVDLPVQQSFLWYRSSEGDASDSQVLLRNWLFVGQKEYLAILMFVFYARHLELIYFDQMVIHQLQFHPR